LNVSGDSHNNFEEEYSAHSSQHNENQNSQNLPNQHRSTSKSARTRNTSPWHQGGSSPDFPEVHTESIPVAAILKNLKLNVTKEEPMHLHGDLNNSNQVMNRMDSQKLCRQGRAQSEILQDLERSVDEDETDMAALEQIYRRFCGASGPGLTSANLSKLCKDCHLFDKNFTASYADILFSKSFPKAQNGNRSFTFQHFVNVLNKVAEKKAVSNREIRRAIAGSHRSSMQ